MALLAFIFLVYSEFIGASVALVLAVLTLFSYRGILIDEKKLHYMKYDRFLWVKIGKWESMSKPTYVTVVRVNVSSLRTLPSPLALPDNKKAAKSYKVNLVVEGDERYINVCMGSKDAMIAEAIRLGNHLNIRVLDYTTHDKKWLL